MSDFEKFLNLLTEYQKAKGQENVMRTTPIERTPKMIAEEAEQALESHFARKLSGRRR